MSYLAPEHKLEPRTFKIISLTRNLPIGEFARLFRRASSVFCKDNDFCDFCEAFAGVCSERFPLIASLLYYGRASALLGSRRYSKQLLLVVCYEIACEVYGECVPIEVLAAMSGIRPARIGACQIAICELMQFEFLVSELDFDRFAGYFYAEYSEEITDFLEEQVSDVLAAPREILAGTTRLFEDQLWMREHHAELNENNPFYEGIEQLEDAINV